MKKLNELKQDDKGLELDFPCLIKEAEARLTKTGKDFLMGTLQTKTGEVPFKKWSLTSEEKKKFKAGAVVQVKATVDTFNGNVQLIVSEMKDIPVDPKEFQLSLMMENETMKSEMKNLIEMVKDEKMKNLMLSLLEKAGEKFFVHCAAKSMHHNMEGGLGTHTITVMKLAGIAADLYNTMGVNVNKDICLCAAFLHDYGKLKEMEQTEAGNGEYTADSILGHIFMGAHLAMNEYEKGNLDYETARQLAHAVLAHHGSLENGSPVEPCTPEAAILSSCDNMDAQVMRISTKMLSMQLGQFDKGVYNRPII